MVLGIDPTADTITGTAKYYIASNERTHHHLTSSVVL